MACHRCVRMHLLRYRDHLLCRHHDLDDQEHRHPRLHQDRHLDVDRHRHQQNLVHRLDVRNGRQNHLDHLDVDPLPDEDHPGVDLDLVVDHLDVAHLALSQIADRHPVRMGCSLDEELDERLHQLRTGCYLDEDHPGVALVVDHLQVSEPQASVPLELLSVQLVQTAQVQVLALLALLQPALQEPSQLF